MRKIKSINMGSMTIPSIMTVNRNTVVICGGLNDIRLIK